MLASFNMFHKVEKLLLELIADVPKIHSALGIAERTGTSKARVVKNYPLNGYSFVV